MIPHLKLTTLQKEGIVRIPNKISSLDRKRFETLVKKGLKKDENPMKAPVYRTYTECFKNLRI